MSKAFVKAFTIMEVLVSMVITAIVIGMVFFIFSIMARRMADFKDRNEPVSEMNRLTYAINKAIFENGRMQLAGNELLFEDNSGIQTKMTFRKTYFVRQKQDFTDTFRVSLDRIRLDRVYSKNQKIVFDRLVVRTVTDSNHIDLQFYKRIYPDELLKDIKK